MKDGNFRDSFVSGYFDDLLGEGRDESFEPIHDLASALMEFKSSATASNCVLLRSMPTSGDKGHLSATVSMDEMERVVDRRRPSVAYVVEHAFDAKQEMLDFDDVDEDTLQFEELAEVLETWKARDGVACRAVVAVVMDGVLVQSFLVDKWFLSFEDAMDATVTQVFGEEVEAEGTGADKEGNRQSATSH